MRVLVLGGTAWLGRTVAHEAVARGHDVTCAARGSDAPPAGVTFVRVDRDDEEGLTAATGLAGRWDAVVDVSRQPGQVRRAVRDLDADHWVFVSTGNVYARFDTIEQSEEAPRRAPLAHDVMPDMESYGEAKVACENAVADAPGTCTIVRSGLIGGPGDASGRTGYWPWRFAHPVRPAVSEVGRDEVGSLDQGMSRSRSRPLLRGERDHVEDARDVPAVVVPDDLTFSCAIIDVRDLASWIVTAGERQLDGVFNATGPTTTLDELLTTAAHVAHSAAHRHPVDAERLRELGIQGWMGPASLPLWIDDPDWRGFATLDTSRARAAGLTTRPLAQTLRDALAYEESRTPDNPRRAGPRGDDERRVLEAEATARLAAVTEDF